MTTTHIAQTGGWAGIVEGRVLVVRAYADGSTTAELKSPDSREVELTSEAVA